MQSMLGLVSTMAEEMQYFRSKISNSSVENNDNKTQIIPNFLGGNESTNLNLIDVSDSEVDEDSDLEEDDDSDLELEEEEDDSELEENNDSDSEVDDDSDLEEDLSGAVDELPRKIINIDLGIDINNEATEFDIETEDILGFDSNTKTISLDLDSSVLGESQNLEDIDLSLKTISIDCDNVATNKTKDDYKKMSLNKLREVVMEKGLIADSSKLKKNELLKLLGAE